MSQWLKKPWQRSNKQMLDHPRATMKQIWRPWRPSQKVIARSEVIRSQRTAKCLVHRRTSWERWSTSPFASLCAGCLCISTTYATWTFYYGKFKTLVSRIVLHCATAMIFFKLWYMYSLSLLIIQSSVSIVYIFPFMLVKEHILKRPSLLRTLFSD